MVGDVVSGGLNFASMLPMAKQLAVSLDKANFDYIEDEIMADYQSMQDITDEDVPAEEEKSSIQDRAAKGMQELKSSIAVFLPRGRKRKKTRQRRRKRMFLPRSKS